MNRCKCWRLGAGRPHETSISNLTLSSLLSVRPGGETGVAVSNWFIGMCTKAKTEFSGKEGRYFNELCAQSGRAEPGCILTPQITKFSSWVIKKVIDTEGPSQLTKQLPSGRKAQQSIISWGEGKWQFPTRFLLGSAWHRPARLPPFTPQSSHPGISRFCKLPTRKAAMGDLPRRTLSSRWWKHANASESKGKSKENGSLRDEVVVTARQPPRHPTGLVAARRLPGKPPEEAATETDVTARRACFRCLRRGLMEQEVVLHVPLKRVIIPIK